MCSKHGISSATFHKWKAKFGGLEVSDTKRLKALEDENAKLKQLLAEATLVAKHAREIDPAFPIVYMTGASANEWVSRDVPITSAG